MTTPAGWFPDPDDPTQKRYWDGQGWTDNLAPLAPPPVSQPAHATPPKGSGSVSNVKVALIVAAVVVVAIGIGVVTGGSGEDEGSASVESAITPSDAPSDESAGTQVTGGEQASQDKPITVGLEGDGNTSPMTLRGSDYRIEWTTSGDCFYGLILRSTRVGATGRSLFTAHKPASGTQHLIGVKRGDYYVEAITGPPLGCPWEVTFTGIQPG